MIPPAASPRPLVTTRRLALLVALVALTQLVLGALLDLYSDEIFYWQASIHPALAYSDLPFVTALLAGLFSHWLPGHALLVRLPFILMATAIPYLVYYLARPVVERQQALEAAALSLCIPLAGFLGLLAVPDVPLTFFGLLALAYLERALRDERLWHWAAAGLFAALGFSTHYRFFPYALGVLLFLVCITEGRRQWRKPGVYVALLISTVGLAPIAWFNLNHDLASLGFYLRDRHPWEFQAEGLLHIFKQMLLVTPPLYVVLALTLWSLLHPSGPARAAQKLFLCVAACNIGIYLLLAPWTDSTSTSIHWPLAGYFPLLVFAPRTLRSVRTWLAGRVGNRRAGQLTLAIPGLGLLGTLVAFLVVGAQAFQTQLQWFPGHELLSDKMAGWKEFSRHTGSLLAREATTAAQVVIAGNYYTAAQFEFGSPTPVRTYNIDEEKAVSNGRRAQYAIWREDATGLEDVRGQSGLFITEDSTLTIPDKTHILARICRLSARVEFQEQLRVLDGAKRFSYYRVSGIGETPAAGTAPAPCPYPSLGWIDSPLADAELSGVIQVAGWVFNEDIGVRRVTVLVDGEPAGEAMYGLPRPDVVAAQQVRTDPNRPNLGYSFTLDTRNYPDGPADISLRFENAAGELQYYRTRKVRLRNH